MSSGSAPVPAPNHGSDGVFSALEREIVELHRFFEDWYNGVLPETNDAFARFERALAPGFHIVTPEGQVVERERILSAVRADHASRGGSKHPIRIWIENLRLRLPGEVIQIATYEEWQTEQAAGGAREKKPAVRGRLSTAVFRIPPGSGPIEWVHVHETWLPPDHRPQRSHAGGGR